MSVKIYTRNNGRGWGHPNDMHQAELAKRFGAVQDDTPHGLAPQQIDAMHARGEPTLKQAQAWWDSKAGSVWSPRASSVRNALLEQALPPGRAPDMKRTGQMLSVPGQSMGGGQGSSFFSTMRPYQPEFESPDRQMFPIHRRIANTYWRLFAKMDPVIASVVEMFSWLPWGDFQLTGEGVDGEVKEAFEYMVTETKLKSILPYFVSEFLIVGEVIPHLFFDDAKGIWTHIALHNPDQVNVVYSPFIRMDTIMEFVPDPKLRELVTSNHPMLSRVRETMPPELVSHLRAGQNVPLSPVNATFIPRKLHPYDLRGTSVIARLWRTLMLEDAIWSATIQTARRAACFVAGTSVLTVDGLKPIEQVKAGDRVIAGNGKVETVEGAWEEPPSVEGLVEVKALGTQPLLCTPNHRFLTWVAPRECACGCGEAIAATYDKTGRAKRRAFVSGHHLKGLRDSATGRMRAGSVDWKVYSTEPKVRAPANYEPLQKIEAQDLRVGDYLVIPRTFDEVETAIRAEAARFLGYFAAEGSQRDVTSRGANHITCKGVVLSFSLAESETWAADAVACAKAVGVDATLHRYVPGEDTKMAQSGREGRTNVYIQKQKDEAFAAWLKDGVRIGAGAHVLSEDVMRWPLALKRELVRGYYRGDGHLGFPSATSPECPQVSAASTSQTLVHQLRIVLAQLGIFASISYNPKGDKPGEENWNDCWILSSTGRDARQLAELVWGVSLPAPTREGRGTRSGGAPRTWCDERYLYVPITSVEHVDDCVPVYNLSVSGDHSYIVEAVQTFNSPLKVAKLGDPASGTIPPPSEEKRVLQLLAQAEMDPQAWLVYNYQIQFDLAGAPERIMSINQHYDLIERIKLVALGVSKSFVSGETSYSCFTEGTQVELLGGTTKAVEDVRIGDEVLDKDGSIQTVEAAWCEGIPENVVEIDLWGYREPIRATDAHQWPVWAWPRTCACGCGGEVKPGKTYKKDHFTRTGGRWTATQLVRVDGEVAEGGKPRCILEGYEPMQRLRSDQLREGDFLLVPRTYEERPTADSEAFARLLGYYVAEGSFIKNKKTKAINGVRFSFNFNEENTWAADVAHLISEVGLAKASVRTYPKKAASVVNSQSARLQEQYERIYKLAGEYSTSKMLAEEVMHWPLGHKRELVIGALRGDGAQVCREQLDKRSRRHQKQFYVAYTTTSPMLARQMKTLLAQLGFFATTHVQDPKKKNGRLGLGSALRYILFVYGEQARKLSRLVWGDASNAPERQMNYRDRYRVDEKYIYVPIRKIRQVSNDKPVYNLTVTNSRSYQIHGGIATYNSAASGLTVFLQRLKAVRDFFVNEWLIPKFFLPVAIINEWIKPSKAQASGGHVRVKRSAKEMMDERRYIIPTIEWAKSLDPQIDKERIDAMTALEQNLGIKITDQKKYASIGLDAEEEQKQIIEELKFKRDLAGQDPVAQTLLGLAASADGGGGGGAMISPGIPPEVSGLPPEGGEAAPGGDGDSVPPAPPGASVTGDEGATPQPPKGPPGESKHWSKTTLDPLIHLFDSFDASVITDQDIEPWVYALKDAGVQRGLQSEDPRELWLAVEQWLIDEGYTSAAVSDLEDALTARGKVKRADLFSEAQLDATAAQLGVIAEEADLIPAASKTISEP